MKLLPLLWLAVLVSLAIVAAASDAPPDTVETGQIDPPVQPETSEPTSRTPVETGPIEPPAAIPTNPAESPVQVDVPVAEVPAVPERTGEAFSIIGQQLEPGELRQFNWELEMGMTGLSVPTPVLIAHGAHEGPVLCLVAAVHGDELNGVEIVRQILFGLDVDKLKGTVVGLPITNAFGFLRSSRYLPDRRDLNRYFPGASSGSMASRVAHSLFNVVVKRCDVLLDIHTGSFHRTNLPQLRADLTIEPVLELTRQFGDIAVLHSVGPAGSLRRAATDEGIPSVTIEAGGPGLFQKSAVNAGVEAIGALLGHMGMVRRSRRSRQPQPVFYESNWVRAETGGILLSEVQLGHRVREGEVLGTVTDPIQNQREELVAPYAGKILGMSVNRVVLPGFAAFHIGRATDEEQAIQSGETVFEDGFDLESDLDLLPEPELPPDAGDEPDADG